MLRQRSIARVVGLLSLSLLISGGCDLSVDVGDHFPQGDEAESQELSDGSSDLFYFEDSVEQPLADIPSITAPVEVDPAVSIEFDFDCIQIDRVKDPLVLPPAGLQLGFRVLDCAGDPIGSISPDDIEIINDEKGVPFGDGLEGGSVSQLVIPANYEMFSVVALDFSDSVFLSGAVDQMIDGALAYVQSVEDTNLGVEHKIALMGFGRPDALEKFSDFSSNYTDLRATLESLRDLDSKGSTDLYGAYTEALTVLDGQRDAEDGLVEKFMVIMTDGTHEAGDEEALRKEALDALESHGNYHIYAIGIDGNYDEEKLAELASTSENFVHVEDATHLDQAFGEVAYRVDAVGKSNYQIGVCTPISLGDEASLTIRIGADSASGERVYTEIQLDYPVTELTGEVHECDAEAIALGH